MLKAFRSLALSALMTLPLMRPAEAVEGGIGAYLLGSRDSFAGIVPGAGHYIGFDYVFLSGQTNGLSIGGGRSGPRPPRRSISNWPH